MRTPSGVLTTYEQLRDAFTRINQEEAEQATPLPDIAPATLLQVVYDSAPYYHCNGHTPNCTCVMDHLFPY